MTTFFRNEKIWQATHRNKDITNTGFVEEGIHGQTFKVNTFQEDGFVGALVLYSHTHDNIPEGIQSRIVIYDTKVSA